jgi:hypothetical protein
LDRVEVVAEMKKLHHLDSAAIGIALAVAVYIVGSLAWQQWRSFAPASNWFSVEGIFIADAVEGVDPVVTYSRTIHQDVHAEFTVSITRHAGPLDTTGTVFCSGQGSANYVAGRVLPPAGTSLAWLMNRENNPCKFTPGTYRARTVWVLSPDGFPDKQLTVDSNYFIVNPPIMP